MSQDKDKNKIDLDKIEELTANKPILTVFMIAFGGLSGLFAGHSIIGLIMMLLALGSVAVSFLLGILPGIIASFIFAGFSAVLTYREVRHIRENLSQNKEALDKNVNQLTSTLGKLVSLYKYIIEKKVSEIEAKLTGLENLSAEKKKQLEFTIKSLKEHVKNLRNKQNEVLLCLAATSSLMTSNSSNTLFNGLDFDLKSSLDNKQLPEDKIAEYVKNLIPIDIGTKAPYKKLGSFLGITNTLTGGLYNGITLVNVGVAIAGLCLGIAAISLVGWPVLVAIIAVGLLITAGTIAYGKARKKQEKALKEVISVNQKVMFINNKLDGELKSVNNDVQQAQTSSETEMNYVNVLEEHDTSFENLSREINRNHTAMGNQEEPAKLLHSVEKTILELNVLKVKVANHNVLLKKNGEETGLLRKIDNCLELARNDKNYLTLMKEDQGIIEEVKKQKQNHKTIEAAKYFRPSVSNPVGEENKPFEESMKQALFINEGENGLKALRNSITKNIGVLEHLKEHIENKELLKEINESLMIAAEDEQFLEDRKPGVWDSSKDPEPSPKIGNKRSSPEAENDCELKKDDGNPSAVNSEHP
jgi:hypothetical protein